MAGNYPNVPSWRFAWDRDGTTFLSVDGSNNIVQQSSGAMQAMNDESDGGFAYGQNCNFYMVLIFPELRDVDAVFICYDGDAAPGNLQTSVDSTNGVDGTWVNLAASGFSSQGTVKPAYRSSIFACTALAVKAIRYHFAIGYAGPGTQKAFHVFGEIAPTVNPNRLIMWHPTLDQHVTPAYFDWGNVPRSSSADRTFRVKNNSSTQSANSVRVAQDILSDTSPSVVGQHTLMKASVPASFLAQVNVGDLAPGAISEVVTLRRVTPSDAVLSVWCHRVFAEAGTWT